MPNSHTSQDYLEELEEGEEYQGGKRSEGTRTFTVLESNTGFVGGVYTLV